MKNVKSLFVLILAVLCVLSLASCGNTAHTESVWDNAVYKTDTEFGEGAKTVICEVKAEEKTVVFTIKTDKDTVGEALFEYGLIEGDEGPYGLYIKKVNGIFADYDVNQRYWAFYIDGELANSGVDGTDITEGVTYQLEYSE